MPLRRFRHTEGNGSVADFRLCANEALAHGSKRNEEGRGNPRGVHAKHRLQHQRRARSGINRRMADEKKLQSFIRKLFVSRCHGLRFLGDLPEKRFRVLPT